MGILHCRTLLVPVLLLGSLATARGTPQPGEGQNNDGYVRDVRAAAQQLVRDLEELQNAVVNELSGAKERDLYRQVDVALRDAVGFEASLKAGVARAELYK